MTLLELLVQELPKRGGGWPQWAAAAVQDFDRELKFTSGNDWDVLCSDDKVWRGMWGCACNQRTRLSARYKSSTLASDHATRIVTREEYEQAVNLTQFEKVRSMLEDVVRQLTDATSVQSDDDVTPLQRIEQLRKARDEAVRAYNDAFVSGEAELRKLKLGDKIITNSEVARHDELVLKLNEIRQHGDGRKDHYVCWFVDEKGNDYNIDNLSTVRFAPL